MYSMILAIETADSEHITACVKKEETSLNKKSMWKITAMISVIICLNFFTENVRAADSQIRLTVEEQEYVQSHGMINMCVDPDWYPYEEIDKNGQHWGIAADLIKLIGQRTGLQIVLIPTKDWDESLDYMEEGKCDILSFLNATDGRKQRMVFTDPYFTDPSVLITRNDHDYISDLSWLSNETIVLPKGTSIEERLRRDYPNFKILLVESEREAMDYVSFRKADLTVRSLTMAAYTIRNEGLFNLKISGQIGNYENKLSIGITKEEPMLQQILNKGIASLTQEDVQAAINHHIPVEIQQGFNYKLLFILSSAFLLIFTAGLLWIMQLRRFNKRLAAQKQELALVYEQLEASEALHKSFLNASPDAVVISDVSGTIVVASPSAYALVGLSAEEHALPGRKLLDFIAQEDRKRVLNNYAGLYDGQSSGANEYQGIRAGGQIFIMEVKSEMIQNANRTSGKIVSIIRDITERRKMEDELQKSEQALRQLAQDLKNQNEELHESATYDKLTGIRNRAYLEAHIEEKVSKQSYRHMSIILFDLDRFKAVNDTYGHAAGDQVLIHIAGTVQNSIRKTDIFARWGGEEFIVFLPDSNIDEACRAAEKIRSAVEQHPYCGTGKITVSLGVAEYQAGEYLHDWIKRADIEMYKAKNGGRNRVSCGKSSSLDSSLTITYIEQD